MKASFSYNVFIPEDILCVDFTLKHSVGMNITEHVRWGDCDHSVVLNLPLVA